MTVTLTYDAALARVRVTADGLAAADVATVERSTDLVRWTTVRGGVAAPVTAGSLAMPVDDYEFVPGVANHYRVRGVETGAISYVGAGAAVTGNSTSLAPNNPAALEPGDLKVIFASIRNSGTGTVNVPAGWTLLRAFGNAALLGRIHQTADAPPTVTFAGGVAGADTLAQMAAWRRAALTPVTGVDQLNASAQDIAVPGLNIPADDLLVLVAGWKQDDATSVAALTGYTEIGEASSAAGDDASQVWDYQIQTTATDIPADSFVPTGGAAAISRAAVLAFEHAEYLNEQTASTTPQLDSVWLKSVTRPFLNRPVTVTDWSDVERPSRGADVDVVGRTLPIGITDVGGSRRFELVVRTPDEESARTLDYLIASGDILYLHVPPDCRVPGGHVRVDTSLEQRPTPRAAARRFYLPLRQVAAPGPDVVGATSTWQTVLDSYATWADVLAANPTWADLLSRVAPPDEVIVA